MNEFLDSQQVVYRIGQRVVYSQVKGESIFYGVIKDVQPGANYADGSRTSTKYKILTNSGRTITRYNNSIALANLI